MSSAYVGILKDLGLEDKSEWKGMPSFPSERISERAVNGRRPIPVAIIGAGISGLTTAIKLIERIPDIDLTIFEKNEDVGGTWWENVYPGVACDISGHAYQLSFESKVDWSTFFAPGHEILGYWQRIADKYGLRKYINFQHEATEARWNEQTSQWDLKFQNLVLDTTVQVSVDLLMCSTGILNQWKWPKIDGLSDFKGPLFHSAKWDKKFDPKGKNIAVIGAGSSGIQIVPELQPKVGKIDHYVRGRTWIAASVRHQELVKRGGVENFAYSEEEKQGWIEHPETYIDYRRYLESNLQGGFILTHRGSREQRSVRNLFEYDMKKRLAKKPEIIDHLIPDFSPGCRRLTPGPGYLEALVADNVNVIPTGISHIDATGVVTVDGKHRTVDAIVCATGFNTTFTGQFPIYGRGGVSMRERNIQRPRTYISITTDEFPNFFQSCAPNGGLGNGNLVVMFEYIGAYVAQVVEKMSLENILTIEPKRQSVEYFSEYCDDFFQRTVWGEECISWYKTARPGASLEEMKKGRVTALWPGSSLHACHVFSSPRYEDYNFTYVDGNPWGWFGNGWTMTDKVGDEHGKSFYINERMKFIHNDLSPEEAARSSGAGSTVVKAAPASTAAVVTAAETTNNEAVTDVAAVTNWEKNGEIVFGQVTEIYATA